MNTIPALPFADTAPVLSRGVNELFNIEIPVPALQRGLLHLRSLAQAWDAARIAEKIGDRCWFSSYQRDTAGDDTDTVNFRPGVIAGFWPTGEFIELHMHGGNTLGERHRGSLTIYAATPAACAVLMDDLRVRYRFEETIEAGRPRIGMLNFAYGSLTVERIPVTAEQTVPRERVALYYGDGITAWLNAWLHALNTRRYGLTVLTGAPGTGKTTLLRSLAQWLAGSHMFYFMPASRFASVESGEIVTFWADENRNSRLRKILILEDAESVLLRRDTDNREQVATLLNLTDGMLGDALGLHVVCTLNSDLADLDPALLRPGRLVAHREFKRLTAAEARRLAASLDLPDPESDDGKISLAEVFNPPSGKQTAISPPREPRRVVGFYQCQPLPTTTTT